MVKETSRKARIHTVYKTKDGDRVPSVTTILGILAKPALIEWAWKLGTEGIDYKTVRDQAGDVGSLAHYLILCDIKGEKPDTSEYSPDALDKAETCLLKYWEWRKTNPIRPILSEESLVSEQYRYGGTLDCLAERADTGEFVLIDFKTGKAIWPEMLYQLAAYENLLAEAGYRFDKTMILRIGRDENEGFEVREVGDLSKHFDIFKSCLSIYKMQKEVK